MLLYKYGGRPCIFETTCVSVMISFITNRSNPTAALGILIFFYFRFTLKYLPSTYEVGIPTHIIIVLRDCCFFLFDNPASYYRNALGVCYKDLPSDQSLCQGQFLTSPEEGGNWNILHNMHILHSIFFAIFRDMRILDDTISITNYNAHSVFKCKNFTLKII